jgi:hypothetical protein
MRCATHNYEYEFLIGKCPYCEAAERAEKTRDMVEQAASQRNEQMALDRAQHEEHLEALESMEDQRQIHAWELAERNKEALESAAIRHEEALENAAIRHEEALERDRQAAIDQRVEKRCNASSRHLSAGRASQALEEAESALDEEPNHQGALFAAYAATKVLGQSASATGYLSRIVHNHIYGSQAWNESHRAQAEWLMTEASLASRGDDLVKKIVENYRGTPAEIKKSLATIRHSQLLASWFENRFRNATSDKGTPPIGLLLDALSEEPDAPKRIADLTAQFAGWAGFNAAFAEWLFNSRYKELAVGYVVSCGQQAPSFRADLAELLIMNGLAHDALSYIQRIYPQGPPPWEMLVVLPIAIEACLRCGAPYDKWITQLHAVLPKLQLDSIPQSTFRSKILSDKSRLLVTSVMVDHFKEKELKKGLELDKTNPDTGSLSNTKTDKFVKRSSLDFNPTLIAIVLGLAIWLLPNGHFWNGITGGLTIFVFALFFPNLYRWQGKLTSEIQQSILDQMPVVNPNRMFIVGIVSCGAIAGTFYVNQRVQDSFSVAEKVSSSPELTQSLLSNELDRWIAQYRSVNPHKSFPQDAWHGQTVTLKAGSYVTDVVNLTAVFDAANPNHNIVFSGKCVKADIRAPKICDGYWNAGEGRTGVYRLEWDDPLGRTFLIKMYEEKVLRTDYRVLPIKEIRIRDKLTG